MRTRLADERGFTLAELAIVSALFLVVLAATLTAAAHYQQLTQDNQTTNVQVDNARGGMEKAMRQLRNLARRIDQPVINRATSSDFIFQTSDPSRTWVRNCLQTRTDGHVWLWSLAMPSTLSSAATGACPGTGWPTRDVVARDVTNTLPGHVRPLFAYGCSAGSPAGCPSTSADLGRITSVTMDLTIDQDLTRPPQEARVTSAVYLRNQNEPPTASFTSRPLASRQVILNASASNDPEGRTLRFMWFRGPAPSFTCDDAVPMSLLLQTGVTMTHTFLATEGAAGTTRPLELVVCDPGGLQARSTNQVAIP
jgi:prepilin-type N-terminal cleavage/methylation domain-containing protein